MILVTGATGNVGREFVAQLAELDSIPFSVLTRSPGSVDVPDGVTVHPGSLDNLEGLQPAFAGVERIFFLGPPATLATQAQRLVECAKQAGARHVVFMSSLSVDMTDDNPLKRHHSEAEQILIDSGLGWTMLRGGVFDSNTLEWAPAIRSRNTVRCHLRNDPYAPIDPADIAAAAVAALTADNHHGQIYRLTGPQHITPQEQTSVLADLLGKSIDFVELDDAEAEASMGQLGPEAVPIIQTLRRRDLPWMDPRPDLEQLTGQTGRTFAQWATRNIQAFR
jgi:uncharacterized protein YbjT (DUF2867 family)